MVMWIVLAVFLVPVIYIVISHMNEKRGQKDELRRIRQRLAEKEQSDAPPDADE